MNHNDKTYSTDGFQRDEYDINGVKTVVYSAGTGSPLVYFHGAGTFHGIDFARDWLPYHRVILPFHPGFGESDELENLNSIDDYVVHYEALFKVLALQNFDLVGLSMGGWLAAEYALQHPAQINKLILAAPGGLSDPLYPATDFSSLTPEEIFAHMVADLSVLEPYLPKTPAQASWFEAYCGRDGQTFGRVAPEGPFNPALEALLNSLSVPTLIFWGEKDRILPLGLSEKWKRAIPAAQLKVIKDIGHLVFDESVAARGLALEFLA